MNEKIDHRAKAAALRQRSQESFDRCDTDGFLTQWGDNLGAQVEDRLAEISDNNGLATFVGLYEGDRRVIAKVIETQFGSCWMLDTSETALIAKRGKRFIPCGKNSRIHKTLGVRQRAEWQAATATIVGRGFGLSGTAWAATVRVGDEWGRDAKLAD